MKQVQKFWKWFQANEETLKNALCLGINTEQVFLEFDRHYSSISKRIGYYIMPANDGSEKIKIIFCAGGYSKLFAKITALEEQAPALHYFSVQSFIKPLQDRTAAREGKDPAYFFGHYTVLISQLYMSILDYNIEAKQLKVRLYFPVHNAIWECEDLEEDLCFVVMNVIGEIAFKKHIKYIDYIGVREIKKGLINLIDLPDYIDYLYEVNSRKKTRMI